MAYDDSFTLICRTPRVVNKPEADHIIAVVRVVKNLLQQRAAYGN
jgi:hypothetical protein